LWYSLNISPFFQTPHIETPLDKGLRTLSFYSIEDGDQIRVYW
jgi:hypothetical protein